MSLRAGPISESRAMTETPGNSAADAGDSPWRDRTRHSRFALFADLCYILTWRDIKIRYKQSVMGMLWAILMPSAFGFFTASLVASGNRSHS